MLFIEDSQKKMERSVGELVLRARPFKALRKDEIVNRRWTSFLTALYRVFVFSKLAAISLYLGTVVLRNVMFCNLGEDSRFSRDLTAACATWVRCSREGAAVFAFVGFVAAWLFWLFRRTALDIEGKSL